MKTEQKKFLHEVDGVLECLEIVDLRKDQQRLQKRNTSKGDIKSGRVDYSGSQENSIYRKECPYHPTREG